MEDEESYEPFDHFFVDDYFVEAVKCDRCLKSIKAGEFPVQLLIDDTLSRIYGIYAFRGYHYQCARAMALELLRCADAADPNSEPVTQVQEVEVG